MIRLPPLPTRLAVVIAATAGCLLYTDRINRRPEKVKIVGPEKGAAGRTLEWLASGEDPDGEIPKFSWAAAEGRCPAPRPTNHDMMPKVRTTDSRFSYTFPVATPPDRPMPVCIWLLAEDRDGASDFDILEASVGNNAPTAAIVRQQPGGNQGSDFPLYSDFRFSSFGSEDRDGDPLTRSWVLRPPSDTFRGSTTPDCDPAEPGKLAACFHADVPGRYGIDLTVSDPFGLKASASYEVVVADDAPPCLVPEGAIVPMRSADPAEEQRFAVAVRDDGDPWPRAEPSHAAPGYPRFTWSILRGAGPRQAIADYNYPELKLAPGELTLGDKIEVRVDVADRKTQERAPCAGDAATCSVSGSTTCVPGTPGCCLQRLTWTVMYQ